MREIKFRAWDKENKIMFRDNLTVLATLRSKFLCEENGDLDVYRHFEFMQYTGLNDKNGTEIYEGDIVRLWESVGAIGGLRREYAYPLPVEYCELWAQFVVADRQNKLQFGIWQNFGAVEIIGNIYENPELLEGMKC